QKFDSNGNFITKFGHNGTANGQFDSPNGIALDSSGNVYVADTDNDRIEIFSPSNSSINTKGIYNATNYSFLNKWGTQGKENVQFNKTYGIAVDNAGNIYVADTYNDRIQKFDSNGNFITKFGHNGTANGQ